MVRLILSYLTFPGVMLHEFAHAWACRRLGVRVVETCYLRLGNPLGYVRHELPRHAVQHIIIAVAPFFVSTLLALLTGSLACLATRCDSGFTFTLENYIRPAGLWLSFSMAFHAFPSSGDAEALKTALWRRDVGLFSKLLVMPVVGLIRFSGLGASLWLDALFALAITALPPLLLLTLTSAT